MNKKLFKSQCPFHCSVLRGEQESISMGELNQLLSTRINDFFIDPSPKLSDNVCFYLLIAKYSKSHPNLLNVFNIIFRDQGKNISLDSVSKVYMESMKNNHIHVAALLELKFPHALVLDSESNFNFFPTRLADKEAERDDLALYLNSHNGVTGLVEESTYFCTGL